MSARDVSSEVRDELELLQNMYEPTTLEFPSQESFVHKLPVTLIFRAFPLTCDDESLRFCSAVLSLTLSESYPRSPVITQVVSSKGLDATATQSLIRALDNVSRNESAHGNTHLLTLLTTSSDFVTDHNVANDCPVCLGSIDVRSTLSSKDIAAIECYRLSPCLHAVHASCWKAWEREVKHKMSEKAKDLEKVLGRAAAQKEASRGGVCPICRSTVSAVDMFEVQMT